MFSYNKNAKVLMDGVRIRTYTDYQTYRNCQLT